jgi:hypothetical protein
MPPKKKTTKKKKVVKNKKTSAAKKKPTTSKTKTRKKTIRKTAKKKTAKKSISNIKKDIEPLVFGLKDHEIDQILTQEIKTPEQISSETKKQSLIQELTSLIPYHEPIVTSKKPKTHNIVIKNIRERHKHSPFVIDLKKLAKKKQEEKLKKQFIHQRLNQHHSRQKNQPEKENIQITAEPQIIAISKKDINNQFTRTPVFFLPKHWYKTVIIFAIFTLIVIAPIKGFTYVKDIISSKDQIMFSSQEALSDIKLAGQAIADHDTDTARIKFQEAQLNFSNASKEINSINTFISASLKIIPTAGKYLTDAERLTSIGQKSATLGENLTNIFDNFYQQKDLSLTEKIIVQRKQINEILLPDISKINQLLSKIDLTILPKDKQPIFITARTTLNQIETDLNELSSFSNYLLDILGHNYKRKYLVIFQNNNEIRATGGFMGSLAIVEFYNGKIENIEIPGGGTYDFQGSLKKQVIAPSPLHLINTKWELQDSNWFFDFPTSAKKIQWFYENSANESVDGVIAINADLIENILAHTEPINMPRYNKTITADNFIKETQLQVEYQYNKEENKPKQFISDLTPVLLEQIFNTEKTDFLGIINEIKTGLSDRSIQMYFNDSSIQNKIAKYDWTGEVKDTALDYLAVVNTNIAGGKTDTYIKQNITHNIEINKKGEIIDTLTIDRTHAGSSNDIFSGARNVNYARIFVPLESKLIEVTGFTPPATELFDIPADYLENDIDLQKNELNKTIEPNSQTTIYNTKNKTVFAGWTQTDPGQTSTISLKYKLPFKLKTPSKNWLEELIGNQPESKLFTVFYQKQSGALNTQINSNIILPNNLKTVWSYPEKGLGYDNTEIFDLEKDSLHGIIVQSN